MFVSLQYNEVEPHQHLYQRAQYLQQLQQQQQQSATATEWTSFYQRQHFQQSSPMSMSPYLDFCNALLPAYSWRHLSNTTLQRNGCCNQQTTSCSSGVSSSRFSGQWTDSVNSTCYCSSRRCLHDYHAVSAVERVQNTADRSQRLVSASDGHQLVNCQSQTPSYYRHQVVGEPDSRSAQRLGVDSEFHPSQSLSQSDACSELDSPPTQCSAARRRRKEPLVHLIIRAILSAADVRLSLAEICRYIEQHSVDYAKSDDEARWQNNVRHTLSHYEFFVKCGRVPTGRGNYWTIHPVCRASFAADDMRIKRARHAVQLYEKSVNVASTRLHRGAFTGPPH